MDEALTELLAEMGHEVDLTNHEDPGEAPKDDAKEDAKPNP